MIELLTGLPGNSKTLNLLRTVIDRAAEEKRPVFYSGIKGLLLDDPRLKGTSWTEIQPEKWMECPDGSIIVIDECQKVFRARTLGSVPPQHVTDLEEHRHRGMDFYVATQHPSLIDPALRRLVQTHRHMVRIFGFEASTVHRWDRCVDHPDKPQFRRDSEASKWVFDKSLYGVYHSATIHTAKARIPLRAKLLVLVPVLVIAAGWWVYKTTAKHRKPVAEEVAVAPGRAGSSSVGRAAVPAAPGVVDAPVADRKQSGADDPVHDVKEYMWRETPRVTGIPQTAPKYDELTRPTRVPVPAMCFQIGSVSGGKSPRCSCYTQQGTPMDGIPFNMCVDFAQRGHFQDFDPDPVKPSQEPRQAAVQASQAVSSGPSVLVIPGTPMGPQRTDKTPGMASVVQDGPVNNRAVRASSGAG